MGCPPVPQHLAPLLAGQPGLCSGSAKLDLLRGPRSPGTRHPRADTGWAPSAPRSQQHRPRSRHGDPSQDPLSRLPPGGPSEGSQPASRPRRGPRGQTHRPAPLPSACSFVFGVQLQPQGLSPAPGQAPGPKDLPSGPAGTSAGRRSSRLRGWGLGRRPDWRRGPLARLWLGVAVLLHTQAPPTRLGPGPPPEQTVSRRLPHTRTRMRAHTHAYTRTHIYTYTHGQLQAHLRPQGAPCHRWPVGSGPDPRAARPGAPGRDLALLFIFR